MICVDGGSGLLAALPRVYDKIPVQRCWTHKIRNILNKVRKADQTAVKADLHAVMNAEDARKARSAARRFAERWGQAYPAAVTCLRDDLDELLTCFRYKTLAQRRAVRTTNAIERRFREVRRRTRPMGVFQDTTSMDRILFAVFTHENKMQGIPTRPAAVRKLRSLGDGLPSASHRSQACPSSIGSGAGIVWLAQHITSSSTVFVLCQMVPGGCAMSETRKIAAILVADMVGYSRLAGADEDRILARLRALRSNLIDPTISVHHGRIVKRTGDGSVIEFRSVVDAVRCTRSAARHGRTQRGRRARQTYRISHRHSFGRCRRGERRRPDGRRRQYRRATGRDRRAGRNLSVGGRLPSSERKAGYGGH